MRGNTLADALGAACYEYDRGLLCHVSWLLLIRKWGQTPVHLVLQNDMGSDPPKQVCPASLLAPAPGQNGFFNSLERIDPGPQANRFKLVAFGALGGLLE